MNFRILLFLFLLTSLITVAITWDNVPQYEISFLGEDLNIQCQVRAGPSPSIDWLHDGELIKTNDHYIINTHNLTIKNVQISDSGTYTCRASVQITGELQEQLIHVQVYMRPSIIGLLGSSPVDIVEGENATIECSASGIPTPYYSWFKSSTQQDLSLADRFVVGSFTGELNITDVNREDEGYYECIAINEFGTANILVNVTVKPSTRF